MPGFPIQTSQEIADQSLEAIDSNLNQETPAVDVAYNRVIAWTIALSAVPQYKYAANLSLQNFAISATKEGLDLIGNNYDTFRKLAESSVLTITLAATTGTVIPQGHDLTGIENGLRYFSDVEVTAIAGVATISVTCELASPAGNLVPAQDTLRIGTPIPGAESVASITTLDNTGTNDETDDEYRPRVLFAIRSVCGGANATDYKTWGEAVAGVRRIYPYTGKPLDAIIDDFPGDRTIYVEATSDIDVDGIAPQSLLDEVRAVFLTDPVTGLGRNGLGDTDENLTILSISRTSVFTEIRDLDIDATLEAAYKDDISTAFNLYYDGVRPFVPGVDFEIEKNDTVTDTAVSGVVDDVNRTYGANTSGVGFGFTPSTFSGTHTLNPGELLKNGGVTYA